MLNDESTASLGQICFMKLVNDLETGRYPACVNRCSNKTVTSVLESTPNSTSQNTLWLNMAPIDYDSQYTCSVTQIHHTIYSITNYKKR